VLKSLAGAIGLSLHLTSGVMVLGAIARYGRAHPVLFGCGVSAFKTRPS